MLNFYFYFPVIALAQQNDPIHRLAKALEKNSEYDQALSLYQNLYQKNSKNPEIINGIKRCYIALHSYQELITFLLQVIQYDGPNSVWRIDLAEAYYLNNQQEEALSTWWNQLEKAEGDIVVYRLVANAMIRQRLYDDAIKVYLQAIEHIKDQYNLHLDIGNLYKIQLDYGNATKHFLDYYLHNPKQKAYLERQLLSLSDRDDQKISVINSLINFLDNNPEQIAAYEILAGIYIKGQDFDKAFAIYKNLDSHSATGDYLQKFAFEAFKNKAYDHAIRSYKLVLIKDPSSQNKRQAQYNIAKSYAEIAYKYKEESKPNLAALNMERAVAIFDSLINYAGQGKQNMPSYLNLGDIFFHYYQDIDQAISNYSIFISRSPKNKLRDEAIIKLGDAFLTKNQIEEAKNSYLLVQHKDLRNIAQFKVCEIYFYQGNFSYALDNYDGLLSKLGVKDPLANDILERKFIIGAYSQDTLALAIFAEAELLFFQNKLSEAAEKMYSLYTAHLALSPLAGRNCAKALIQLNKLGEAKQLLMSIKDTYPVDDHIDEVIFLLAQIEENLGNYNSALNFYKEILIKYPNSLIIQEVREKARVIKDKIDKEAT